MDGETKEQVRGMLLERRRQMGETSHRDGIRLEEVLPQSEATDMAQTLEQIGRETSLAEQERRELLAIERALSKMSKGLFGACEECGEAIPARRLLVMPEARYCADCQAREERLSYKVRPTGSAAR